MDIPIGKKYGDLKASDYQPPKYVFNEMKKFIIRNEKLWVNN